MNRPRVSGDGLAESGLDESGRLILIVHLLKLGRKDVSDQPKQSLVVVPAHPIERRELDVIEPLPGSSCLMTSIYPISDNFYSAAL